MHPNLAAKLSSSGQAPASKSSPDLNARNQATAAQARAESDSVLIQRIRVVYRGDIEHHLGLLRRAGLLQGAAPAPQADAKAQPQPEAKAKSGKDPDPLFPPSDAAKAPEKPFTLPEENEVARRIQMAMSSAD